jgi:hypothetical protein
VLGGHEGRRPGGGFLERGDDGDPAQAQEGGFGRRSGVTDLVDAAAGEPDLLSDLGVGHPHVVQLLDDSPAHVGQLRQFLLGGGDAGRRLPQNLEPVPHRGDAFDFVGHGHLGMRSECRLALLTAVTVSR